MCCVLRVRAEGLLNLDENGIGGLSDPFLRISRMINAAETERDIRKRPSGLCSCMLSGDLNSVICQGHVRALAIDDRMNVLEQR